MEFLKDIFPSFNTDVDRIKAYFNLTAIFQGVMALLLLLILLISNRR